MYQIIITKLKAQMHFDKLMIFLFDIYRKG